jgi:hypothetical protein
MRADSYHDVSFTSYPRSSLRVKDGLVDLQCGVPTILPVFLNRTARIAMKDDVR